MEDEQQTYTLSQEILVCYGLYWAVLGCQGGPGDPGGPGGKGGQSGHDDQPT